MARSVVITAPIPTWQQMADVYGLSKSDRSFIDGLFAAQKGKASPAASSRRALTKARSANQTRGGAARGKSNGRARKSA